MAIVDENYKNNRQEEALQFIGDISFDKISQMNNRMLKNIDQNINTSIELVENVKDRFSKDDPSVNYKRGEITSNYDSQKYNAQSPSISKTLNYFQSHEKNVIMVDDQPLILTNTNHFSPDYPPFYRTYKYDHRLNELGANDVVSAMVQNEINDNNDYFNCELEYVEKKTKFLHWYDYVLYHSFSIDRLGYFKLEIWRQKYQHSPWKSQINDRLFNADTNSINESMGDEDYDPESLINTRSTNKWSNSKRSGFTSLRSFFGMV